MHNINVISRVGVSNDETCFEQIIFTFYLFERHCDLFFLFTTCTFQVNLFGNYVCKCSFDMNYHASTHLMCRWKKERTFFFGGLNMKDNFQQLPI